MENLILYVFNGDKFEEYASFEGESDYLFDAQKEAKEREEFYSDPARKNLEQVNSAKILSAFVSGKFFIAFSDFKKLMRALRHFDELGISNDLYDLLEEISDAGEARAVALVREGEDVSRFTQAELSDLEV